MIDGNAAQAALASDVRAGRWVDVRAAMALLEHPLPAAVAIVAARAAAHDGGAEEALGLLRAALPRAGELAAALRLEAGAITIETGGSPWEWVGPLLHRGVPVAQRQAAGELLRRSWQQASLALLREQLRTLPLHRALRRSLEATLAVRAGEAAVAIRLLRERTDDEPAARAARWLATQPAPSDGVRLVIGEALLAAGEWREAERVLAPVTGAVPPQNRSRLAYVRGRVAYRLGQRQVAAVLFDEALASAASDEERFAAAVQRARLAELTGDRADAVPLWDAARHAAPAEVEGWDGGARARALVGRGEEAAALLRRAPPKVMRIAGPRLVAVLLAHGDEKAAQSTLSHLSRRSAATQVLTAELARRRRRPAQVRSAVARLLADRRAGPWRSLALSLLPRVATPQEAPVPRRDARGLAALAVARGPASARAALAAALTADPAWRPLLTGTVVAAPEWSGPAWQLAAVGLEAEAALLYPGSFPSGSPAALAWTAHTLAAWGNGPAALSAGERLAGLLGDLPPALLPDSILPFVLPPGLTVGLTDAAHAAGTPPAWLAAIVRRESRFDLRARSRAGAIGIAQVVPETARRLGVEPTELWDGDLALELAARELARIAARFEHRLPVVAAAYNAGDEVVVNWLEALGDEDDDVLFAAAVPYGETSEYVLSVVEGAMLARHLE